jgi:hypothetical protein|tara:strand:+ start:65 stop:469 length:405 start_codon:yes stop_codon:yes gene_type:complete
MNYWIIVENYHNRLQDANHSFEHLGVDLRKFERKKFNVNDILITYITKIMKFSDMRKVVNNEIKNLPETFKYDLEINKCIETKIIQNLDEKNWIDSKPILTTLEAFKEKKINLVLLNAPVKISKNDYDIINKYF